MRLLRPLVAALAGSLALAATAAAQGPPPPTAANGATVQTVAQGVPTPTQFAFGGGTVFAAAGGAEDGSAPGGVFVLKNGTAVNLPGSPKIVFGVVWHRGTLYVSALDRILAWSKWNGKKFKHKRVVYKSDRKHFSGFTGLAYRDGRLYTGGSFGDANEFKRLKSRPYDQTYLSLKTSGKGGLKIVSRGLRQPWQSTFVKGHARPFLTVLSQDNVDPAPPDYIVSPKPGLDFGFPKCNGLVAALCKGYAKPFATFPQHTSPMGISPIGQRLYVAEFGPMAVASLSANGGGTPKTFLSGYVAPVVALGTHRGWVYTGDLTGAVYRAKP